MTRDIAQLLIDNDPSGEMALRESYSGRGMYGKTTCAVQFPEWRDLLVAVADTIIDLDDGEASQVRDALNHASYDQMGLGMVIY